MFYSWPFDQTSKSLLLEITENDVFGNHCPNLVPLNHKKQLDTANNYGYLLLSNCFIVGRGVFHKLGVFFVVMDGVVLDIGERSHMFGPSYQYSLSLSVFICL